MLNRKHIVYVMLAMSVLCIRSSVAGDKPSVVFLHVQTPSLVDSQQTSSPMQQDQSSSRKTTALIYSCVMPGSGQTMVGHTYKGLGFTLSAFGSLLTAVISHNNFVARGERLDALEYQYLYATNWVSADALYTSMREAHGELKSDKSRRDLFLTVAAIIWAANIVDVLYNTDDEGETLFSLHEGTPAANPPSLVSQHNPLLSISLRLP